MGIGEITSWKSCRKLPIAEVFSHVTIASSKVPHQLNRLSVLIGKDYFYGVSMQIVLLFCRSS